MTTERIARLPRWAQEYIRNLEMRLEEVKRERDGIAAGINGSKESYVYVNGHSRSPKIWLPTESTVAFVLENEEEMSVSFGFGQHDFDRTEIKVRSNWHQMQIKPEAANTVTISSKR